MLTMVLVTVAGLLGALGGMGRIDLTLYDRAVSLSGRPASPEILIVMIDDDSIATLGRWPWSRTVHAALLDKLGEARAVGLDIIFAEPDRAEPAVDAQLAEAIRRNGKVVLPVVLNRLPRATGHEPPLESLAQAAAALGFINVELDTDGVLRRSIWTAQVGTALWPHFSLSLMSVGGEAQQALQFATAQLAAGQTRIPYAGPRPFAHGVVYQRAAGQRTARMDPRQVCAGGIVGNGPDRCVPHARLAPGQWHGGRGDHRQHAAGGAPEYFLYRRQPLA